MCYWSLRECDSVQTFEMKSYLCCLGALFSYRRVRLGGTLNTGAFARSSRSNWLV